ncbi:NPP1-domain-containing protein [Xylaria acuta]|nr:NPP1-domain-containing protein [Xylaria acuta]
MGLSAKTLALCATTLALSANASVLSSDFHTIFKREPPKALPSCATDADKKWQPAMDFDKDGCYNTPAIDADGNVAEGLQCGGAKNGNCRDESDLDNNNVYSRARCNNGWCGFLYGYYFEKDQSIDGSCGVGHPNDWEHVVVWVKDGDAMPSYVGASQHGNYEVKPASDVRFQDTHAKIVYHQDGGLTHSMRFANEADDAVENHKGVWFFGGLVGYSGFPTDDIRSKMLESDWGSAVPDIMDERFADKLEDSKGGNDIPVDTTMDNENSPGEPQGC